MTCILGIEHEGKVWIGSDSFLGTDTTRDVMDRPKWFWKGPLLLAYSGDCRSAQVIEHSPNFRVFRKSDTEDSYLITVVAEGIRKRLGRVAAVKTTQSVESSQAEFIMAFRGKLYTVQEDLSIIRSKHGYVASGAGQEFALGALAALYGDVAPEECMRRALEAAGKHSSQVCAPYHVICV